jgi:serine/threonine-protein kinase RsbW
MNERVVELSFPASAQYLVLARLGLAGIAPLAPLDEESLADLKLAVTEACANAVRHAYADEVGQVSLRIALEESALTIEIADNGRGIDVGNVRDWTPEELEEQGMGFEIMRSVVDEVEVDAPPNGGTVVRLVKRLPIVA